MLSGLQKIPVAGGNFDPEAKQNGAADGDLKSDIVSFTEVCNLWNSVANLVLRTWPFFRCYKEYAVGHAARGGRLAEDVLNDEPELVEFLFQKHHFSESTLEAELIKPVQRILKYSLFLRDALNNIRKGNVLDVDEDPVKSAVSALEQALVVVNRVSNEVNEALSQNEQSHKILGLWARIGRPENFLQPGRELLYLCKVEMAPGMDTQKERSGLRQTQTVSAGGAI